MFMNVCMLALMVMVPSHSVPISGAGCAASAYTRGWEGLLHKAAVAKNDTRFGLLSGGSKYGLSNAEAEWLAKVTGRVICPGDQKLKGAQGSGSLIGRNDQVLTNAHVLRNLDGTKRDDWSKCYFEAQSQPPVRRNLKIFDPGTMFGTRHPDGDRDLDYVIVRLEDPILGVEPIRIGSDGKNIAVGQSMLMVSAIQKRMKKNRAVGSNEPVIQSCEARDIIPSRNERGMVISSNCSSTDGASGSIVLARDAGNQLVAIGLHARGGDDVLDGKEYDATLNKGNHSYELMFDGPLYKDLQRSLEVPR